MVWQASAASGARIALSAMKDQRFRAVDAATGIWIKMGAPARRPLPAIPLVKTISMLVRNNAVVPMMVDVDVIEADVIVVIMVVVTPSPPVPAPTRAEPSIQARVRR